MMEPPTERDEYIRNLPTHSRRRVLRGIAGGAIGIVGPSSAGAVGAKLVLAKDEDNDDDHDHSGPGGGGDNSGSGGGDDDQVITGEIPAGSIEVRIVGDDADDFVPGNLTVDLGQSVTFVNAHSDEHTATGSGFDTGIIPEGGTATVVLDTPGTFAYACQIHPEMTGTIAVRNEDGEVPPPEEQAAPEGATQAQIVNFAFDPPTLTVAVGTTVAWTNNDSAPHTVTAEDGSFDSGIFDPGATFSHEFTSPGSFAYRCNLHPQMQGVVEVTGEAAQDAGAEATPTPGNLTGAWTVAYAPLPDSEPGTLQADITFNDDGTLEATFADTDSGLDLTLGPAHGVWSREDGSYRTSTSVFLLDSDQRFGGVLTFHEELRLDASGDAFQGTYTYDVQDANGEVTESGEGETEGTRSPGDAATPVASPATGGGETTASTVSIVDFAFEPATIEVPAGSTVTWRNDGQAPHTATALDGAFDTGQLDAGQEGQGTFDQPGTFDYRCDFHPDMLGTVVVT